MFCENCMHEHIGIYGSGRFCSKKCARGFATKSKRKEINKKISKTLYKGPYYKICLECNNTFEPKRKYRKFCSNSCSLKYRWKNIEYRNKMSIIQSDSAKNRHLNNEEKFGWQSRDQLKPSYPESIAIKILDELNIEYIREHKVNKYFIDFAIGNLALEIDGQQHNIEERKNKDRQKDIFLENNGWNVIRIKYPEENIRATIFNMFESIFK